MADIFVIIVMTIVACGLFGICTAAFLESHKEQEMMEKDQYIYKKTKDGQVLKLKRMKIKQIIQKKEVHNVGTKHIIYKETLPPVGLQEPIVHTKPGEKEPDVIVV